MFLVGSSRFFCIYIKCTCIRFSPSPPSSLSLSLSLSAASFSLSLFLFRSASSRLSLSAVNSGTVLWYCICDGPYHDMKHCTAPHATLGPSCPPCPFIIFFIYMQYQSPPHRHYPSAGTILEEHHFWEGARDSTRRPYDRTEQSGSESESERVIAQNR